MAVALAGAFKLPRHGDNFGARARTIPPAADGRYIVSITSTLEAR